MHQRKSLRKTLGKPSSKRAELKQSHYDMRVIQNFEPLPAKHPCDGLPGSPERIETLTKRVDAGECLWHPNDRTCFSNNGD